MGNININKKVITVIVASSCLFTLQNCGSSQTDISDTTIKVGQESATVSDTEATSLSISNGSAAGTNVNMPPGALPTGSTLAIGPAATPEVFDLDNVESAGASIELTATSSSGESITELSSPMTLSLPISGTSLALVAKSDDNLCVFLSVDSSLIVWRKADITIGSLEGKRVAQISSLKLGIFRLVYCGTESLSGFQDANDAGAAGGTSSVVSLTIDTGTYGLGANKICVAALAVSDPDSENNDDDGPDIMMGGGQITVSGSEETVEFDAYTSVLNTDAESVLGLLYIDSSQSCPDGTPTATFDSSNLSFVNVLAFPLDRTTLEENEQVDISIGSGDFSLAQVDLTPKSPPSSDQDVCVTFKNKEDKPYFSEYSAVIGPSGIDGSTSKKAFYVPADSLTTAATYKVEMRVGELCGQQGSGGSTYEVNYPSVGAGGEFFIDNFNLTSPVGESVCAEFYSQGQSFNDEYFLFEATLTSTATGYLFLSDGSDYSVDWRKYYISGTNVSCNDTSGSTIVDASADISNFPPSP